MSEYYTVLTNRGAQKVAAAIAGGPALELTDLVVGDGGGGHFYENHDRESLKARSGLVNQRWSGPLYLVDKDPQNPAWAITEGQVPVDVGGWYIREVGIKDSAGDLIAIGVYPETYKPVLAAQIGADLTLRSIIEVGDANTVTLKIDPSVVQATREWVDQHKVDKKKIGPSLDQIRTAEVEQSGVDIIPGNPQIKKYENLSVGYAGKGIDGLAHCLLIMDVDSNSDIEGYACGELRFSRRYASHIGSNSGYHSSRLFIQAETRPSSYMYQANLCGDGVDRPTLGLVRLLDGTRWLAIRNNGPGSGANPMGYGGFYGLALNDGDDRARNFTWATPSDLIKNEEGEVQWEAEGYSLGSGGAGFFGRPGDQIGNNTAWHSGNTIVDADGFIKGA